MTKKLTPEEKAKNKRLRELKNKMAAVLPEDVIIPISIHYAPTIKELKEKGETPFLFQVIGEMLDSFTENDLNIFVDRMVSMSRLTISEWPRYPEEIKLSEDCTVTREQYFDLAVSVNTFLSNSPFNKIGK